MRHIALFLFALMTTFSAHAELFSENLPENPPHFMEGKDYQSYQEPLPLIKSDQRIKIEFFFDYDCRVCSEAQDTLVLYSQINHHNVNLTEHPISTAKSAFSAQLFYTLQIMEREDLSALFLFETADKQRYTELKNMNGLLAWLEDKQVDTHQFVKLFYSAEVATQVKSAVSLTQDYGVFTYPYVVIEGQYVLTASTLYSDDYTFAVLDFLTQKIKEKQE